MSEADNFFDRLQEAVFSSSSGEEDFEYPDTIDPEFREGDAVSHYRIVSLIGSGGMGAVFRARDTRLNREVALKFLPSHLGSDPVDQARLLVEARAAAALDHPNVCRIHEVGQAADGRLFIAMPCYDGETLKDRVRRESVSFEESATIALHVARGLEAAHSCQIIHRDIKPGNVILAGDGTARLLDFGLAVEMSANLTRSGVIPGTVAYMSPEQIRGNPLDARTDLWSLGVVLYEMLAGARPFSGADRATMSQAILQEEPEPISRRSPDVPTALASIVDRLLQKDPARRYQSARALAGDLENARSSVAHDHARPFLTASRGVLAAAALAVLIASGIAGWRSWRDGGVFQWNASRAKPSIAVLPFANLGGDSSDGALARGLTEEFIATLASAGDIRVIASTSVATLKQADMDVRQIADSLGVTSLLQGGIQKTGSKLHVTVRLVDGRDGATRWARTYDRDIGQIFAVQEDIARAVAGELELRFDKDRQFLRHRTRNMQAYELYLRGSDPVLLRGHAGIWKAQDYFQKAIAADPTYAAAHAGLAITYLRRARNASDPGMPVPQLLELAETEARKAVALDTMLAEAHYALGRVREGRLNFRGSTASLQRAIQLDPNRSIYRRSLGFVDAWTGRPAEEQLRQARRALETDPLNPYSLIGLAGGLCSTGRYDEALVHLQSLTDVKPPLQAVSFLMAQCYAKKNMWSEAIATLRPGAESGEPMFIALLGNFLGRTGQPEEARRVLSELVARRERMGGGAFHIAVVYAGLGNTDQAFAWLDKSIADGSIASFIMGSMFEELHRDPRFQQLRTRLGLQSRL